LSNPVMLSAMNASLASGNPKRALRQNRS
jgi:hypothetical protein